MICLHLLCVLMFLIMFYFVFTALIVLCLFFVVQYQENKVLFKAGWCLSLRSAQCCVC